MELHLPYEKEFKNQIKLLEELQGIGFNIVTCPDCGSVILCKRNEDRIRCYDCGEYNDPEDCPDLYY